MSLVTPGGTLPSPPRNLTTLYTALILGAAVLATATISGPLLSVRKLDPSTGKVIFNETRATNAQGRNQRFDLANFDAAQYVSQQWALDVEPVVGKFAVDLGQVVEAIRQNPAEAASRFAVPHDSQAKNFIVRGLARVDSVNLKSPVGLLGLQLLNTHASSPKIELLAGPLVISTALRDVASNMSLNHFTNQSQYADVASALNKKALERAYATAPAASLAGKTVEFIGVFSLQTPSAIRILPISLTVKE